MQTGAKLVDINGDGIKLPTWSITVILFLIVQTVTLIVTVSTIKNNQSHLIKQSAETRFVVGNIQDGMRNLNDNMIQHTVWDEMKTESLERDIDKLEEYHPR
jgi:hypothetical protein